MTTLDLDFVRAQFPSFTHPQTGRWAHLENAGGSYCPLQVVDLLADLFAHAKCQPEWDFGPSVIATEAMDRSRTVMAELFNASEDEIHFGPSTSQNTYVLAKAMRPMWSDGDEITPADPMENKVETEVESIEDVEPVEVSPDSSEEPKPINPGAVS